MIPNAKGRLMLYSTALTLATAAIATHAPQTAAKLTALNADTPDQDSFVFRAHLDQHTAIIKVADPARLKPYAERLLKIHTRMNSATHRVPEPLAYLAAEGVLIMADAQGKTAQTLWRKGGADAARTLAAAGGWIARYHALWSDYEPFNPDPHLNWLRKTLTAQAEGDLLAPKTENRRQIPDIAALKAHLPDLERLAEASRAEQSLRCITHRDFHLRNLLIRSSGRTYGIDFENTSRDEAMRDLLFFLHDAARLSPDPITPETLKTTAQALRASYARPPAGPHARLYFQRCFALNLWAGIDASISPMGPKRQRTLQVAQAMAEADDLFADPT